MKALAKLSFAAVILAIGAQGAAADALQKQIQARKDITAYGMKFECPYFVAAANRGDLVSIDAFIRAGIDKKCQYTASNDYVMTEPDRARAWSNNALTAAVSRGHYDAAQMLLDYGVPFEQERKVWSYTGTYRGDFVAKEFTATELYPRPTLTRLLYPYESEEENRLKSLEWAVKRGADVNATDFISTEVSGNQSAYAYAFVVSPLTAAMRLEKLGEGRAALYERSLSWVEYLLKNGAKLNPPLAPIVNKAIKAHQRRWSGRNAETINYPFDLSVLFEEGYANQGYGIFADIAAVNYRIKLANLLIKYQNAKTDPQKYSQALGEMKEAWDDDKKGKRFPPESRKALAELNKIIQSRMM